NTDEILKTFMIEGRELLDGMETALLGLDPSAVDAEAVNAIFRAAHTIKGSAGLFGLDHVVAFTHAVESVLDAVRDHKVALDTGLIALALSCCDHIGLLLDAIECDDMQPKEETGRAGAKLVEQLLSYLEPTSAQPSFPARGNSLATRSPDALAGASVTPPTELGVLADHWHISLRFGRDVLRNGMDPLSFIRYLGTFGRLTSVTTIFDALPSAEEMDPEACYLGFEIAFQSKADKATIEGVFDFVRDDCSVQILPPNSRICEYIRLIEALPEETTRLGEILVRCGTLTPRELAEALAAQQAMSAPSPPIGELLASHGTVHPAVVEAALAKQRHVKQAKSQESLSIRVDSAKLDHLIDLVGELIIAAASSEVISRRTRIAELSEWTHTLAGLVSAVRDSALQLRMVKIGATFNRFQRVVHDVSLELGKGIGLEVRGEDTELDKTVVERIADPLTHLVRNAMDHGIEAPDVRRARGKPAQGTVELNAYHDSGSIVIEVTDDGGGLKREKILAKAIERGLAEPGRVLSDVELYDLVFEPGFSTAEKVTNLSGRGVGMDVVKRDIVALHGSVTMRSEEGVGTTVTVRLPLTLAIINGFLVGLGGSTFVVPLEMIEECVEFSAQPGHDYTSLRGNVLPFIRLRELFGVEGAPAQRQNIVVVKHGGRRAGLVVDTLLGEFQTVIKPLNKAFSRVKCISGSSILGTGEVALILDVPTLVRQAAFRSPTTNQSKQPMSPIGN
ncbi:MAG TPA: chemotaxis protein CheA, partial [Polyangiaceae bacterium]